MHQFHIIKDHQLVLECYAGYMSLDTFRDLKTREAQSADYNPKFHHLCDLRLAHINFSSKNLKNLVAFMHNSVRLNAFRKSALLVSDPYTKAYSKLYQQLAEVTQIETELFYTIPQALHFFDLEIDPFQVETILDQMRQDEI